MTSSRAEQMPIGAIDVGARDGSCPIQSEYRPALDTAHTPVRY